MVKCGVLFEVRTGFLNIILKSTHDSVSLGGLVVIMLATGLKVREIKSVEGDGFLRAINSAIRPHSESK
jgi:hypothetical protein